MVRRHGSPPSLRWRRRLLLLGAVLLAALTGYVLVAAGDRKSQAGRHASTSSAKHSAAPRSVSATAPAPVSCVPSVLGVAATTDAKRYSLAQRPVLEIEVMNTGEAPCRANLSDSQIELLVYNGSSRVWSSHDCNIRSGSSVIALAPRQTVRRSIRWSGMSSLPKCAGTRQRVGAGSYTLHALFAGIDGRTATFSIS